MATQQNYIYAGGNYENIPQTATHVSIHESIKVIEEDAFYLHPNIIELICHSFVKKIEEDAFNSCSRLKRLVLPGVEEVEEWAFYDCEAIEHIECDKLEIIRRYAFQSCESLIGINLPSINFVGSQAFDGCTAMIHAKFGKDLERMDSWAFTGCRSLERITIPLKRALVIEDDVFAGCQSLKHVDLVEGDILRETVEALHLESWRDNMNARIETIIGTLQNSCPGVWFDEDSDEIDEGDIAMNIRYWILIVLTGIIEYKAKHRAFLNSATAILQTLLPNDIVMNNLIPYLDLPSYKFDGEE